MPAPASLPGLTSEFVEPLTPLQQECAELHQLLADSKNSGKPTGLVAAVTRMLADPAFAAWVAADSSVSSALATESDCWAVANRYLYRLLYSSQYAAAALLLWGPDVFDPRPRSSRLIFGAFASSSLINVMGGASSSKTYSGVAWLLLDWVLDPEWTQVLLVGPDRDHLKRNAFGDLIRLHESSVLPLPGKADTESLSTSKTRGMGFFAVALDRTPAASAKLKGAKTKPRDVVHPRFGRSSRLRVLLDEAQQVPVNAWPMLLNLISNLESKEHLKIFAAANPDDEYSQYGKNCRPVGGWAGLARTEETWTSETGWTVVRLNAMFSENVRARRVIFPRLIDYDKVQSIIRGAGGDEEAASVYTQVYGMFPPHGASQAIVAKAHVESAKGEWIFEGRTTTYLSNDPAYTGDRPATCSARFGRARAWRDEAGTIHHLKFPKNVLQLDAVGQLSRGDTQEMADQVFQLARELSLSPECFAIDRTGIGQGLHDLVRRQWQSKVRRSPIADTVDILGVHYAESATEVKIAQEDVAAPCELYANVATEVWYALARWFELGLIRIGKGVELAAIEEIVSRRASRSSARGKRLAVEGKDAYKARGNSSPDFADAICLVLHCVRLREEASPPSHPDTPEEPEAGNPTVEVVDQGGVVQWSGAEVPGPRRDDPWQAAHSESSSSIDLSHLLSLPD